MKSRSIPSDTNLLCAQKLLLGGFAGGIRDLCTNAVACNRSNLLCAQKLLLEGFEGAVRGLCTDAVAGNRAGNRAAVKYLLGPY
jgi:hypothetical protein